jgi:hypothetical protein
MAPQPHVGAFLRSDSGFFPARQYIRYNKLIVVAVGRIVNDLRLYRSMSAAHEQGTQEEANHLCVWEYSPVWSLSGNAIS